MCVCACVARQAKQSSSRITHEAAAAATPLCSLTPSFQAAATTPLSVLSHPLPSFLPLSTHTGYGVKQRFSLIEDHWLYFLGYGVILASFSLTLRFWDLFVVRSVLYPVYIANAPYARFHARRAAAPLPVFRAPLLVFNAGIHLAALKVGT